MSDSLVNQGRILRNLMRLMDVTCRDSLYEVLPRGVVWLPELGLGAYPDLMVVAGAPLLHDDRVVELAITNTRLPMMDIYAQVDFSLLV